VPPKIKTMAVLPATRFLAAMLAVWALACLPTVLAANSAGCGKAPTLTSGEQKALTINNKSRKWILRLPSNYDKSRPYKLIFGLHWLNADYKGEPPPPCSQGTAGSLFSRQSPAVDGGTAPYYGLRALDKNQTAIFVAPDGLNKGWGNAGGEDVTFIDEIMKKIEEDLCVNEAFRFTLGFSYGGAMSYSLACSRPDIFRAVAVLSGSQLSGCSGGTKPVAYYGQHGVKDSVLNISGGRSLRDKFLANNGCTKATAQEPASGSRKHIKTTYTGCSEDHPVQWTAFDGDHTALPNDSGGDGGPNSWTIAEVWTFFSQFK